MGIPQIIVIILLAVDLGINLAKHGEPKPPYSFTLTVVSVALTVGLLWWGGFWR